MKSYDRIAWLYDILQSFVFGDLLTRASCSFLAVLGRNSDLLILGGGTGKVLTALNKLGHTGKITFVDSSEKMIGKARKRAGELDVEFILSDVKGIEPPVPQDAVHMSFFLDQFDEEGIRSILKDLENRMGDGSLLLVSDFVRTGSYVQRALLYVMYAFFRYFAGINAGKLEDIPTILGACGYEKIGELKGARGFVCSWVFRKSPI